MKRQPLFHQKLIHENGAIEERIIWDVPKTKKNVDGIRYRLVYVAKPGQKPCVLYDNHFPKGHHKHLKGSESAYLFSTVEKLLKDFQKDIREGKCP